MQKPNALKEVFLFMGLTLGLSYFVFWGPLAFFQIPTISFVRGVTGPSWAIALFITGGFVPSLVAVFLTWQQQGGAGLRQLGRRMIQVTIGWQWYLAAVAVVLVSTLAQLILIGLLGQTFDLMLFVAQLGSALPLVILGPLSEEIGWRGYALDRPLCQDRIGHSSPII
jgi:membrane protease YdiL (CAAX protease family)